MKASRLNNEASTKLAKRNAEGKPKVSKYAEKSRPYQYAEYDTRPNPIRVRRNKPF